MSAPDRTKSVFTEPWQWGLRGDQFLWNELRDHFSTVGVPVTSDEFVQQVESKIKDLSGSDVRGDQPIFVERYDAGGMSSGHISPEWWVTKGVPLLKEQFTSGPVASDEEDSLE